MIDLYARKYEFVAGIGLHTYWFWSSRNGNMQNNVMCPNHTCSLVLTHVETTEMLNEFL